MAARTDQQRGHRRRGWRVSTVLIAVAVVPLAGMSAVTWDGVSEAQDAQDAAARTGQVADDAFGLVRLHGAVFDEMVASAVLVVASDLRLPEAMLSTVVGGDPATVLATAVGDTDAILADIGHVDLTADVARARDGVTDLSSALESCRALMAGLENALTDSVAELTTTTSGRAETDRLLRAARVLADAIDARSAIAEGFYGYFATIFPLRDTPAVEVARLIHSRERFDEAITTLEAAAVELPELRTALTPMLADSPVATLNAEIDTLISRTLSDGVPDTATPLSLQTIIDNVTGFRAVYESAAGSSAATSTLVNAAVVTVRMAVDSVREDANRNIRQKWLIVAILTTTTALMVAVAARFIVRPLRSLRRAAEGLQDATIVPHGLIAGPLEVRAALVALADAGTHLDLATQQVRALAAGELDAAALDRSAPGGLGTAVQHAVATLRSALARQDEFRRRLTHEATHDGLTQLSNRDASMKQLERSLARTTRAGSQLAVFFIDLDRFKDVNDHHGHHAGDIVLTTVAQRLVTTVREGDHVGRLGGDEFVVIAEPVASTDDAIALATRLRERVTEPIEIGTALVSVGASIGIAIAHHNDLTADELLRDADLAVYRAKQTGHCGIDVCDETLRNELAATTDLTIALQHAIDHDELVMHYQPILDTHTRQLDAYEALVRWERPHVGLVPPDEFIGFAERSHLIIDLDQWVLDAVARQLATWHTDPTIETVPVAINISRRHLAHDNFVEHILEPLRRTTSTPPASSSKSPKAHSSTTSLAPPTNSNNSETTAHASPSTTSAPATPHSPTSDPSPSTS